jgi:hypothetical protein
MTRPNLRYLGSQSAEQLAAADAMTYGSPESLGGGIRTMYCSLYRQYNPKAVNYGDKAMPQWDGGRDRWGANHRPIWPRLASHFMQHSIDPAIFLHVQFAETIGRASPTPNMFFSHEASVRYTSYLQRAIEELVQAKERSAGLISRRLRQIEASRGTPEQKILTVVMDEHTVQACPLFRYCFAMQFNIELAAAAYFAKALHQYMFQHAQYDQAWGVDFIPVHLRETARQVRSRLAC